LTLLEHFLVLSRPVELELLQRLAARKHDRVDGKSLGSEVGVEEAETVPDSNASEGVKKSILSC
jgi:hypothetical protein